MDVHLKRASLADLAMFVRSSRLKLVSKKNNLILALIQDRKSTRLNSSHSQISYAVFCLKKKNQLVAGAGFQLLLAAHGGGLHGAWVCSPLLAQEPIQNTLNLSPICEPHAMYFMRYPA